MADDNKWVEITHPKIDADPARVTRKAYETVYKDKGWKLASGSTSTASTTTKKES